MASIEIRDSFPEDVNLIKGKLRPADTEEILAFGITAAKALWRSYKGAIFRRTAFVDGEIAAIWGCGGTVMGDVGRPWLLTTYAAEKISPLRFTRIYQDEVLRMLDVFPRLVNYVDSRYTKATRLLDIIGFELDEPEPVGVNGILFQKFEMRAV